MYQAIYKDELYKITKQRDLERVFEKALNSNDKTNKRSHKSKKKSSAQYLIKKNEFKEEKPIKKKEKTFKTLVMPEIVMEEDIEVKILNEKLPPLKYLHLSMKSIKII